LRRIGADIIQPKLKVSSPNDKFEREADQVAEMVVGTSNHYSLHRSRVDTLQKNQINARSIPTAAVPESIGKVINSGRDHPLDKLSRKFMGGRFGGQDFAGVRIHTNANAAETARIPEARAFTVGRDIGFAKGQYAPDSTVGDRLLAHELSHVIQQRTISSGLSYFLQRQLEEAFRESRSSIAMEYAAIEREILGDAQYNHEPLPLPTYICFLVFLEYRSAWFWPAHLYPSHPSNRNS
jgi:hypothetical protein